VGETWANYTFSYVNAALGDAHRHHFTVWASNYLQKGSAQEDVDPNENDLTGSYIERDYYAGMVKHYA
jgi:hypothetical protein